MGLRQKWIAVPALRCGNSPAYSGRRRAGYLLVPAVPAHARRLRCGWITGFARGITSYPRVGSTEWATCRFQLFDHRAVMRQRGERARALRARSNLAIHIEDVLPGLAVDGPRLDLGKVGPWPRAHSRMGQCPGPVLEGERQADLVGVGVGGLVPGAAYQEEPGIVFGLSSMSAGRTWAP